MTPRDYGLLIRTGGASPDGPIFHCPPPDQAAESEKWDLGWATHSADAWLCRNPSTQVSEESE